VVLLGDPLRSLPLLIGLSRATLQTINQNILYFAFGVNIVGIVITGWLWPLFAPTDWMEQSPLFAVVYHQFGSFAVLLNSMRLLWYQRESNLSASNSFAKFTDKVGAFVDRLLDIDEHFDFIFHNWQKVFAATVATLLLIWLSFGFTQIQSNEIGLVQRMGRLLDDQLEPGLHWRLPIPFEKVTRIQPSKVRTIEIGFRTLSNGKVTSESGAWNSRHESEGFYRVPDESVMITGDGNLMEIQGSIRYAITDPRKFLFNCNDVEAILRANTESILRELVGSKSLGALLTEDRGKFQFQATNLLETRITNLDASVMGIRLEGLSLHDLHPPQEVVRSYYAVTQAMEMRDRKINDALGAVLIKLADEQGRALLKERLAQAFKDEVIDKTKAQADVTLALLSSRVGPSAYDDFLLITSSLIEVLEGRKPDEVARITLEQLKARRDSWKALADFRRFWNAISSALAGRDKIILDSDKPVKSNLWLMPSDFFRMPGFFSAPVDRQKPAPKSNDGGLSQ
jgi:Cu+-exporting ATPase